MLWNIPFRNRHEARQARLRGEQIVKGIVEPTRTLGVGEAVADREDASAAVVQHVEPHLVGQA